MLIITGSGSSGVTGNGTVNSIPLWVNTTQLGDSVLRQVGSAIIVGALDPDGTATETFRTRGGIISQYADSVDSVVLGRGAVATAGDVTNLRSVIIGALAKAEGVNNAGSVVIGYNSHTANGQGGSVVIGQNINWINTGGPAVVIAPDAAGIAFPGVVIGAGASVNGTGVAIGNQVSQNASNTIAIGRLARTNAQFQVTIGDNANGIAGHTSAITLGANAVSRGANCLTIGAANVGIFDVLIGEGVLSSSGAVATTMNYRHTGSQGTDSQGGIVNFIGSLGTGQGIGGGIRFQVGQRAAASGLGGQATITSLELENGSGNIGLIFAEGGGVIGNYAGARGAMYIGPAAVAPTGSPSNGFLLYVDPADGNLKLKGSGGTVTTIATP